jgi:hypothetical protein
MKLSVPPLGEWVERVCTRLSRLPGSRTPAILGELAAPLRERLQALEERLHVLLARAREALARVHVPQPLRELYELVRPTQVPSQTGLLMILGSLPALVCSMLISGSAVMFAGHRDTAFRHFAEILERDPVSWFPITLATLCSLLALLLPCRKDHPALIRRLRDH